MDKQAKRALTLSGLLVGVTAAIVINGPLYTSTIYSIGKVHVPKMEVNGRTITPAYRTAVQVVELYRKGRLHKRQYQFTAPNGKHAVAEDWWGDGTLDDTFFPDDNQHLDPYLASMRFLREFEAMERERRRWIANHL